jgi:iron-sulfur cluster assembly protein
MRMEVVKVTDFALTKMREILSKEEMAQNSAIRIGVVGGGCSGLSYKIEFSSLKDTDNILDFGDLKICIDPKSSIYLEGSIVDFQDGLQGKGFIFKNPAAKNTCGCGESFSL